MTEMRKNMMYVEDPNLSLDTTRVVIASLISVYNDMEDEYKLKYSEAEHIATMESFIYEQLG